MECFQFRGFIEEEIIERIIGDPVAMELLRLMNWTSYTREEIDNILPGCDEALELLLRAGVIVRKGDLYTTEISIQSYSPAR